MGARRTTNDERAEAHAGERASVAENARERVGARNPTPRVSTGRRAVAINERESYVGYVHSRRWWRRPTHAHTDTGRAHTTPRRNNNNNEDEGAKEDESEGSVKQLRAYMRLLLRSVCFTLPEYQTTSRLLLPGPIERQFRGHESSGW